MDRTEAIEVLLNLKLFVKMNREEDEAFDMAIAALEGKDIDAPSKEEAIPVDWIKQYMKEVGLTDVKYMVETWEKEQIYGKTD